MKEIGCEREAEVDKDGREKPVDPVDLEGELVGQKQKDGKYGAWKQHKHEKEKDGSDKLLDLIKT